MPRRKSNRQKGLSPEIEELLIDQVREHPALFDISDKEYYNSRLKTRIWEGIGQVLNEDKDNLQSTWVSIRAKFKRELKKAEIAAAEKKVYTSNWSHFNSLLFIKEAAPPRLTFSNLDNILANSPAEEIEFPDSPTMSLPTPGTSHSNQKEDSFFESKDEDMIFFMSLLHHVKQVPTGEKLKMRNDINATVMKYAYENQAQKKNQEEKADNCSGCCASRMHAHGSSTNHQIFRVKKEYQNVMEIKRENKKRSAIETESDDSDCEIVGVGRMETRIDKVPKKSTRVHKEKRNKVTKNENPENDVATKNLMQQVLTFMKMSMDKEKQKSTTEQVRENVQNDGADTDKEKN